MIGEESANASGGAAEGFLIPLEEIVDLVAERLSTGFIGSASPDDESEAEDECATTVSGESDVRVNFRSPSRKGGSCCVYHRYRRFRTQGAAERVASPAGKMQPSRTEDSVSAGGRNQKVSAKQLRRDSSLTESLLRILALHLEAPAETSTADSSSEMDGLVDMIYRLCDETPRACHPDDGPNTATADIDDGSADEVFHRYCHSTTDRKSITTVADSSGASCSGIVPKPIIKAGSEEEGLSSVSGGAERFLPPLERHESARSQQCNDAVGEEADREGKASDASQLHGLRDVESATKSDPREVSAKTLEISFTEKDIPMEFVDSNHDQNRQRNVSAEPSTRAEGMPFGSGRKSSNSSFAISEEQKAPEVGAPPRGGELNKLREREPWHRDPRTLSFEGESDKGHFKMSSIPRLSFCGRSGSQLSEEGPWAERKLSSIAPSARWQPSRASVGELGKVKPVETLFACNPPFLVEEKGGEGKPREYGNGDSSSSSGDDDEEPPDADDEGHHRDSDGGGDKETPYLPGRETYRIQAAVSDAAVVDNPASVAAEKLRHRVPPPLLFNLRDSDVGKGRVDASPVDSSFFSSPSSWTSMPQEKLLEIALQDCFQKYVGGGRAAGEFRRLTEERSENHEKSPSSRIREGDLFFQVQEAQLWYSDFWQANSGGRLPALSVSDFGTIFARKCLAIRDRVAGAPYQAHRANFGTRPPATHNESVWVPPRKVDVAAAVSRRVPAEKPALRGTILLNGDLTKCLMVQGWHGTAWTFPRGKVLGDWEGDVECATREIWEEVGVDVRPLIDSRVFIESLLGGRSTKLFIVAGIDEASARFASQRRKEIRSIRWIEVQKVICSPTKARPAGGGRPHRYHHQQHHHHPHHHNRHSYNNHNKHHHNNHNSRPKYREWGTPWAPPPCRSYGSGAIHNSAPEAEAHTSWQQQPIETNGASSPSKRNKGLNSSTTTHGDYHDDDDNDNHQQQGHIASLSTASNKFHQKGPTAATHSSSSSSMTPIAASCKSQQNDGHLKFWHVEPFIEALVGWIQLLNKQRQNPSSSSSSPSLSLSPSSSSTATTTATDFDHQAAHEAINPPGCPSLVAAANVSIPVNLNGDESVPMATRLTSEQHAAQLVPAAWNPSPLPSSHADLIGSADKDRHGRQQQQPPEADPHRRPFAMLWQSLRISGGQTASNLNNNDDDYDENVVVQQELPSSDEQADNFRGSGSDSGWHRPSAQAAHGGPEDNDTSLTAEVRQNAFASALDTGGHLEPRNPSTASSALSGTSLSTSYVYVSTTFRLPVGFPLEALAALQHPEPPTSAAVQSAAKLFCQTMATTSSAITARPTTPIASSAETAAGSHTQSLHPITASRGSETHFSRSSPSPSPESTSSTISSALNNFTQPGGLRISHASAAPHSARLRRALPRAAYWRPLQYQAAADDDEDCGDSDNAQLGCRSFGAGQAGSWVKFGLTDRHAVGGGYGFGRATETPRQGEDSNDLHDVEQHEGDGGVEGWQTSGFGTGRRSGHQEDSDDQRGGDPDFSDDESSNWTPLVDREESLYWETSRGGGLSSSMATHLGRGHRNQKGAKEDRLTNQALLLPAESNFPPVLLLASISAGAKSSGGRRGCAFANSEQHHQHHQRHQQQHHYHQNYHGRQFASLNPTSTAWQHLQALRPNTYGASPPWRGSRTERCSASSSAGTQSRFGSGEPWQPWWLLGSARQCPSSGAGVMSTIGRKKRENHDTHDAKHVDDPSGCVSVSTTSSRLMRMPSPPSLSVHRS